MNYPFLGLEYKFNYDYFALPNYTFYSIINKLIF